MAPIAILFLLLVLATCVALWHVQRRVRMGLVDTSHLEIVSLKQAAMCVIWAASSAIPIYAICNGLLTDVIAVPRGARLHRDGAPLAFWTVVAVYYVLALVPLASSAIMLRFGGFRRFLGGANISLKRTDQSFRD
jgi:hypothetical protein